MILSTHILLKEDRLYLSKDYLVHLGMNEETVRQAISRNNRGIIATFDNIRIKGKAFVDYDTINWSEIKPFRDGARYPEKHTLIDEYEKDRASVVKESLQELTQRLPSMWNRYYDEMDEVWYRQQKVNEGRAGDQRRSEDLATGMAILRFMQANNNVSAIKQTTDSLITSKKEFQTTIGQYLTSMNPPLYGFPKSYDNIRKLFSKYLKAVQDSSNDYRSILLHGNKGNDHHKKLDATQELIMKEYYLQPKKPDAWSCWRDYINYFTQKGFQESALIGYTRFKQYFSTTEMQLISSKVRDGSAYYEAHFRPFILGKMPEYSMSLISGDGWEPGRSVKFTWINKNGEKVNRVGTMNVWYWADWKSKYILSHRISGFENSKDIRQSFRDILALNEGKVPRSIMIDAKWVKQSDVSRMLKKAGVMIQEKEAYHPQTNYIERINKEMNKLHRQIDEHWVDMTNNDHRFKHNEDHVRGVAPLTEEELNTMILQLIHLHNNTRYKSLNGKTPREVFEASISPDCKVIDPLHQSWIFGDSTVTTVRNFTLKINIATRQYEYLVPNEHKRTLLRELGNDWKVKVYYDERHMDTVDLYAFTDKDSDHTDRYLCTAIHVDSLAVNRSKIEAEGDPEHGHKLGYQKAGRDTIDTYIDEFMEDHQEQARKLNIDLASVKAVSQDKYKEAMSNEVAKAYNRYYEDQGVTVAVDSPTKTKTDARKKLALLEKRVNDKYSEDFETPDPNSESDQDQGFPSIAKATGDKKANN